jgi:hypothetical protein
LLGFLGICSSCWSGWRERSDWLRQHF